MSGIILDQISNWTLLDGIVPLYEGGLGVDVRSMNHYRVVTIKVSCCSVYVFALRFCLLQQEPFVELGGSNQTFGFQGYCIDLLEALREDLNFTYELYLVPDGKFGVMEQTGYWNGMIGQLANGQADIALGPLSMIAERDTDIDFTISFYDLVGTLILMKRNEIEYSLFKFLKVG